MFVADGRLLAAAHQRRPAAVARPREGRDPPRDRRARERGVGSLGASPRASRSGSCSADLSPEQFVACIDFRYLTDALTPEEALDLLAAREPTQVRRAIAELARDGYPAYLTSAGWLGYDDEQVRDLCREALADGWRCFKTKVGLDLADDVRRCEVMREEIGDLPLMADANQVWDVDEAIESMRTSRRSTCAGSRSRRAPTTCSATRPSAGGRAGRRRDRRARRQPRDLQAAPAGRGDRLLPDRRVPARRGQRGAGGAPARGEVRRSGLPARRRPRPVRVRAAPLDRSTTSACRPT